MLDIFITALLILAVLLLNRLRKERKRAGQKKAKARSEDRIPLGSSRDGAEQELILGRGRRGRGREKEKVDSSNQDRAQS